MSADSSTTPPQAAEGEAFSDGEGHELEFNEPRTKSSKPAVDPMAETLDAPSRAPSSRSGRDGEPAQSVYLAGDVIAEKYRLSKILGEGGMGAVWLAKNLTLDIDVAVKLIRREFATAEASQRLLQEARAAARIGHASIVRVFDFGTTERKDPFIVMEVLHGESLAQTLSRRRRLSALAAVRTLLPVASALAAAHAKGIVHRDLKPDNVLLVNDDRGVVVPKVVDFGIAKLHNEEVPRTTTQAGVILGSPHYMSPEQACGRSDVDHRTDIWAFCVMLYEAVVGVRPFEGANYNALISSILVREPLPFSEQDLDEDALFEIVQKGLAKEVNDRWQTMRDLGAALAAWAQDRGIETDAAGNSLKAHWLEPSEHRPLSDTPPPSSIAQSGPRPRLISERELPPLDALPRFNSFDDGSETTDSPAPGSAAAPSLQSPVSLGSPPSSLPMPTSSTRPPEGKRSAAFWIGPLALAIGAIGAAAWILLSRSPKQPLADGRAAAATEIATVLNDKPPAPEPRATPLVTTPVPSTSGASSVSSASNGSVSSAPGQVPSQGPATSASNKTSTKKGGNMPVPLDPNF